MDARWAQVFPAWRTWRTQPWPLGTFPVFFFLFPLSTLVLARRWGGRWLQAGSGRGRGQPCPRDLAPTSGSWKPLPAAPSALVLLSLQAGCRSGGQGIPSLPSPVLRAATGVWHLAVVRAQLMHPQTERPLWWVAVASTSVVAPTRVRDRVLGKGSPLCLLKPPSTLYLFPL